MGIMPQYGIVSLTCKVMKILFIFGEVLFMVSRAAGLLFSCTNMTHLMQKCASKGLVAKVSIERLGKCDPLSSLIRRLNLRSICIMPFPVPVLYIVKTISTLPSYVLFYHSCLSHSQCLFARLLLQARSIDSCISFTYRIFYEVGSDFLGPILPIVTIHLPHNHTKEDYSQSVYDLSHISSNQTFSPHNYNPV